MRHVIDLVPLVSYHDEPAGRIEWDDRAGTVTGDEPLATRVREVLESAQAHGSQATHPIPSSIRITKAFRVRRQFAAVLGWHWRLPGWLMAAYPRAVQDNRPGLAQVTYAPRTAQGR